MPKLQPETADARRRAILDAACRCFREHGFHQSSIKDICVSGGFSPGALYIYFDSKEALIEGIIQMHVEEARSMLQTLQNPPDFLERMAEIISAWFREASNAEEMAFRAEVMAESLRNPRIRAVLAKADHAAKAIFADALRAAIKRGELDPDLDVDAATALLFAVGDGLTVGLALDPDLNAETTTQALRQMLMRWLLPLAKQER
jgi:TetR/AcrR family transcriptional regulator, repressor for uid operon